MDKNSYQIPISFNKKNFFFNFKNTWEQMKMKTWCQDGLKNKSHLQVVYTMDGKKKTGQ